MILQALNTAYGRFSREKLPSGKPRVPPFGYSYERISFALVLDTAGKLLDVEIVDAGELDVPTDPTITRTSAIEPMFLWDKTAYVLGLAPKIKKLTAKIKKRTAEKEHGAFKKHQRELIGQSSDEGLQALLSFLDGWVPSADDLPRYRDELIGTNVVFKLAGDEGYLHDRPAAREVWQRHLQAQTAREGLCLISGQRGRIALTHPSVGGVRGAQSSGAAIVSFNQEAFRSYGKEQGANAPVSAQAAFAYTTALNDLLRKGSRQRVQIADATTVFWAEAADPEEAEVAERAAIWLFEPSLDDAAESLRLRTEVMERIEKGHPLEEPDLKLAEGTRFYILGLAPNVSRLSVRFWEATTLGALGNAFHQHWCDLWMDGLTWRQPPALWQLLARTAPARRNAQGVLKYSLKQIPPNLAGELTRAILTGRAYPRTILPNVLMRFRSDHELDGLRVALVKAAIVRDMRRNIPDLPKETYVSLNRDDPDPAYRLGRLFAILEKTQQAALDNVNATIRDRFYGSASATPCAVFPILIKNGMHHLAGLRKGRGARWVKRPPATGTWLSQEMGDILDGLDKDLPKSFTIEAQGRFAIGYFHQKYARRDDAPDDLTAAGEPNAGADDSDDSDSDTDN
jgi:CRISPR-associated protein Csd1